MVAIAGNLHGHSRRWHFSTYSGSFWAGCVCRIWLKIYCAWKNKFHLLCVARCHRSKFSHTSEVFLESSEVLVNGVNGDRETMRMGKMDLLFLPGLPHIGSGVTGIELKRLFLKSAYVVGVMLNPAELLTAAFRWSIVLIHRSPLYNEVQTASYNAQNGYPVSGGKLGVPP